MKIVIAALTAPCRLNGVSRHAANLARGLLSLPNAPDVHLLAGAWQKEMFPPTIARIDSRFHFHWIQIRNNNIARIAWYYRELPAIAAQLEADVVHLTCPAPVRAGAYKSPTVVSLHDLYPFDIPANFGVLRSEITRRLMRQCLTRVDAIACVSAFTRAQLALWFSANVSRKALTIPNSMEPICGAAHAPEAFQAGQSFVLCVAQHRQNKNVPLAIMIFARALQAKVLPPHSRLLVLGINGPETRRILKELRELRLEDKVVLRSGISDQEILWCYRNCLLLLAPSSIEGFGLPVAEALIAGCPVVCSDIPPFREIGGNHCRYVAFGKGVIEGYLRAMQQAMAAPRQPGISRPEFAPASIASSYMELYRQLNGFLAVPQYGILPKPDVQAER